MVRGVAAVPRHRCHPASVRLGAGGAMSGQRKAPRPVGRGYMPKGGAAAAAAQNARWQESVQRRAAESAQPHTVPVETPAPVVQPEPAANVGGSTYGRASDRESARRSPRLDLLTLPWFAWLCVAVVIAFGLLLGSALMASAAMPQTTHVDCVAFPEDPECVTPPPDPSPTVAPDPSPTVAPDPSPSPAPGVDTGVYLDPATGSLRVDENTGVALGVACWLAAVVAGLGTAWMVLP